MNFCPFSLPSFLNIVLNAPVGVTVFYKFLGSLSLCGLLSLTSLSTARVETRTSVAPAIRALLER